MKERAEDPPEAQAEADAEAVSAEAASAEARMLQLAIQPEVEPLGRLRTRLEADDGERWVQRVLEELHARAGLPLCPDEGASLGLQESWDVARHLRVIDGPKRELGRYILMAMLIAREPTPAAGERTQSLQRLRGLPFCFGPEDADELLELAGLVPQPWFDCLGRAALWIQGQAGSRDAGALSSLWPRVPGYRLLELIGRGGTSVVYRALQRRTQRVVALKLLVPTSSRESGLDCESERLKAEILLLGRLRHPGIALLLDAGSYQSPLGWAPFLVLEHVAGRTLGEHIRAERLGTRRSLQLFLELCDAMASAHRASVLHRDLHPENVLVTSPERGARIKLCDFALARSVEPGGTRLSQAGSWFGRPGYMSPEHVNPELDLDARADVYSLGAILFELCAGRPPLLFTDSTTEELSSRAVAYRIQHEDPPHLQELDAKHPFDLGLVVDKALARDRNQRYSSVEALSEDLRCLLSNEPVEARPPSRTYLLRKFCERERGLVLGAAAFVTLLVTALALTLVLLGRAREAEQAVSIQARIYAQAAERTLDFIAADAETYQIDRSVEPRIVDWIEELDTLEEASAKARSDRLWTLGWRARELLGDVLFRRSELAEARRIRTETVRFWEQQTGAEARSRLSIALVKLGDLEQRGCALERCRSLYWRAMSIDRELAAAFPNQAHYLDNLIWSYDRHGALAATRGDTLGAASWYAIAEARAGRLVALDPERTLSYLAWGDMALKSGARQPERRAELFALALECARIVMHAEPDRRPFANLYQRALDRAAREAHAGGDTQLTETLCGESHALLEAICKPLPASATDLAERALYTNALASLLEFVGRSDESQRVREGAKRWALEALKFDREHDLARRQLALAHSASPPGSHASERPSDRPGYR